MHNCILSLVLGLGALVTFAAEPAMARRCGGGRHHCGARRHHHRHFRHHRHAICCGSQSTQTVTLVPITPGPNAFPPEHPHKKHYALPEPPPNRPENK